MNHEKHFHAAKNLVYLMIVLIGFCIVAIFNANQFDIMRSNTFNLYFILTTLGAVLLVSLLYLLSITLIAINPAKQFSQANDTKRRSDVNAILNAIDQYAADNKGQLPASITTTVQTHS